MLKIIRKLATATGAARVAPKTAPVNLNQILLTGRDLICPKSLTVDEMKSLLWTALDLKECDRQNAIKNISMNNAAVSLVLQEPSMITEFSVRNAAKLFDIHVNTVVLGLENLGNDFEEFGFMLNTMSDMIICHVNNQNNLEKIADGAQCPVVGIKTDKFTLIEVLTNLMTIQETFNYLKSIKFSWIGITGPLINTYMCILPKFSINFNYVCVDSANACVSPCLLQTGMKISQEVGSELHEFVQPQEAILRSQVVATSPHTLKKLCISNNEVQGAASKWGLLDSFPRQAEVDTNLYNDKNSLVYKNIENMKWIYAALMIRLLKNYNHETEEPPFDDYESNYQKFDI